jgi:transglutaminase-like putative cysteine protease
MRKRILFAVLGLAITGLALSGLLGVLGILSNTSPSAAQNYPESQGSLNTTSPAKSGQNLTENFPSQALAVNAIPSSENNLASSLPSEISSYVCPACQGNPALGSGLCPICGGNGKISSRLQQSSIISPQGGLGPHVPLFLVNGALNTDLLRSIVTASYDGTNWLQDPEASINAYKGENIKTPVTGFNGQFTDQIKVTSIEKFMSTGMTLPTSLYPVSVSADVPLTYLPSEQRFVANQAFPADYSFKAVHYTYDQGKLNNAQIDPDQLYLQVPSNISTRIKQMAAGITAKSSSPYQKAQAIEYYLKSNYQYSLDYRPAPADQEANDWFLFDEKKGVCSNFNSAFVILARSAGIPSRLVDGYKINLDAKDQVVYASQAHAWSEIKLKDLGWITFDATGNGPGALATITDISSVASPILKGKNFTVQGTVLDSSSKPVDGVSIELFINTKKETTGGIEVGKGVVKNGSFDITAAVPLEVKVGPYQLMAHSLGGIKYQDSWSDPPVTVLTGTAITLDALGKIKVNDQLTVKGILTEESSRPIPGQEVNILLGEKLITSLRTDENGQFIVQQSFNIAGEYTITASYPGSDYYLKSSREFHFQVLTPTRLSVSAPQKADLKQPLKINGTLSEEISGLPLPDNEIEVIIDGQALKSKPVTTVDGSYILKYTFGDEGLHQIEARFDGIPKYFESTAATVLEITPSVKSPGLNLVFPIIILLVVVLGVSVFFLVRRRKTKRPVMETVTAADISETEEQPEAIIETPEGQIRLNIEFPGIEPALPDVWGEGNELEVVCDLKNADGSPLVSKKIDFYIGKSINRITTGPNGSGLLQCTFKKKGQYQLTAKYKGEAEGETASASRTIRIVDYREEIVDLFRALLEWLRVQGLSLPSRATPREIKKILAEAKKAIPSEALDKVITGFEEADYSLHNIERASYKSMYLAQKEIREHESTPPAAA